MAKIKNRIRDVIDWYNDYYMAVACAIVGIPLLGLIAIEIACYVVLWDMNARLAALGM